MLGMTIAFVVVLSIISAMVDYSIPQGIFTDLDIGISAI